MEAPQRRLERGRLYCSYVQYSRLFSNFYKGITYGKNKGKEDVVVECIMKPYVRIDERGELFFGRSFVKT
jgi:hypothetical protein